jgi:hypothetical protein
MLMVLLAIAARAVRARAADATSETTPRATVVPLAYVEAYYAYNFARPSNGITNYRAFDNRHDTFSLTNAAAGVAWESGAVSGRLVAQVGSTPSSYYLSEPNLPGTSVVNATGTDLWKFLQEAYVGYKLPFGRGLAIDAGIFLAPIGPEAMAVKDNWNWSRSYLFEGLPFYVTGARATYAFDEAWSASLAIYNGWNSVVDNNTEKSILGYVSYHHTDKLLAQLLYFGGVEWPIGAPEGRAWRSDFDVYARWSALDWLSLMGEFNAGFDPNAFGTSAWYAGALYTRFRALSWLYLALRGDRFYEHLGTGAAGTAPPIFWGGAKWVTEGTATVDVQPIDRVIVRLEYRHDQAESPLYFRGSVGGSGTAASPFVANSETQDTLTVGATTWF